MKGHRVATQKNRNLTVYTSDADATAKALTEIAAALEIEGQRGPSPSELVKWIYRHKGKVIEALKPVRKAELGQKISNVDAARTGERAEEG